MNWRIDFDRVYGRLSMRTSLGSLSIVVWRTPHTRGPRIAWCREVTA